MAGMAIMRSENRYPQYPQSPQNLEGDQTMSANGVINGYPVPLNRELYEYLWNISGGDVIVEKIGQPCYMTIQKSGRKRRLVFEGQHGEEYRINCPVCGDTRHRCHINHSLGTRVEGLTVPPLVHCFNEGCASLSAIFLKYLESGCGHCIPSISKQATVTDRHVGHPHRPNRRVVLKSVKSVDDLGPDHPAVKYLHERGFKPEYLTDNFNVAYYECSPRNFPAAQFRRRLIVPIVFDGNDVGWAARVIPDHTPLTRDTDRGSKKWPYKEGKYINSPGLKKSNLLYNLDVAKKHDVIAVAEGVTDVWKIGIWSVAILGKKMSDTQVKLLCEAAEAKRAWIVLLGDASTDRDDAASAWYGNYHCLVRQYRYPERVRLHLFDKGDPGDKTTQELHALVSEKLNEPPPNLSA